MRQRRTVLLVAFMLAGLGACGDQGESSSGPAATADLPWLTFFLAPDGSCALDFGAASERTLLTKGDLGQDDPNGAADVLEQLRTAMAKALEDPRFRNASGHARIVLRVDASPGAKWRYVQWALQTAAHPTVRITHIDLRERGDAAPTRIDLPSDQGLLVEELEDMDVTEEGEALEPAALHKTSTVKPGPRLTIRFFRRDLIHPDRAYTTIRVGDAAFDLARGGIPGEPAYLTSMAAVEAALKKACAAAAFGSVYISTPPPRGPSTPYGDVLRVIRFAKALTHAPIYLEGSPIALRGR